MNILVPIIYTIIGGFVGFCGALIVECYKRKQLEKDFKEGLCAEFREALPQFVSNYYYLNRALGNINRNMLNWTYSMLSIVDGKSFDLTEIDSLLKLNNDQLIVRCRQIRNSEFETMSLKKFNLSFLRENIPSFSLLDSHFRRSALAIRTTIIHLNEEINLYNSFYEKTFAPGLTPENSSILDDNMKKSYKNIAHLCYETAEMIKKLIL
jgi:hypothetical protein